jgi:hypothetical protein
MEFVCCFVIIYHALNILLIKRERSWLRRYAASRKAGLNHLWGH